MPLDDIDIDVSALEISDGPVSFPKIPDEMVASVALGMEDDLIVAARHGLSVEQFRALEAQPWFQLQVAAKRAEFERNGITFKAKSAWMAMDLLDQVYMQASNSATPLSQKHDVLKTLIKAAGLEPKEERKEVAGPGFQIIIDLGEGNTVNLSAQAASTKSVTFDVDAVEVPGAE